MDIKDIEKLEEQAKQGDAEAQINLGICYYKGNVEGVKQNYEEAVKWFKEIILIKLMGDLNVNKK